MTTTLSSSGSWMAWTSRLGGGAADIWEDMEEVCLAINETYETHVIHTWVIVHLIRGGPLIWVLNSREPPEHALLPPDKPCQINTHQLRGPLWLRILHCFSLLVLHHLANGIEIYGLMLLILHVHALLTNDSEKRVLTGRWGIWLIFLKTKNYVIHSILHAMIISQSEEIQTKYTPSHFLSPPETSQSYPLKCTFSCSSPNTE